MSTTTSAGEAAYDAYGENRGWRTANGGEMPRWADQRPELREAWDAAAIAARAWRPAPLEVQPFDHARVYRADELRFSATARCVCGSGLAYHRDSHELNRGAWRCAAAMMHTLPARDADPNDGKHVELPFAFYEVRSEDQSPGETRTTRPT